MKGLEALKYLKENNRLPNEAITRGCVEDIEKELKALEIIRKQTPDACNCLMILKIRKDDLSYEKYCELFLTELIQEEFELLKEGLL